MSFEKTLQSLADKKELHAWVDDLPEGAKGIIILELPETKSIKEVDFGEVTLAEACFYVNAYLHWHIFSEVQS